MKRIFVPLLAAVFAVAFSAFTRKTEIKVSSSPTTEYQYWYEVEDNRVVGLLDEDKTKDQMLPLAPCPDDGETICAIGSNTPISNNTLITPSSYTGDARIAFDE